MTVHPTDWQELLQHVRAALDGVESSLVHGRRVDAWQKVRGLADDVETLAAIVQPRQPAF